MWSSDILYVCIYILMCMYILLIFTFSIWLGVNHCLAVWTCQNAIRNFVCLKNDGRLPLKQPLTSLLTSSLSLFIYCQWALQVIFYQAGIFKDFGLFQKNCKRKHFDISSRIEYRPPANNYLSTADIQKPAGCFWMATLHFCLFVCVEHSTTVPLCGPPLWCKHRLQ